MSAFQMTKTRDDKMKESQESNICRRQSGNTLTKLFEKPKTTLLHLERIAVVSFASFRKSCTGSDRSVAVQIVDCG